MTEHENFLFVLVKQLFIINRKNLTSVIPIIADKLYTLSVSTEKFESGKFIVDSIESFGIVHAKKKKKTNVTPNFLSIAIITLSTKCNMSVTVMCFFNRERYLLKIFHSPCIP